MNRTCFFLCLNLVCVTVFGEKPSWHQDYAKAYHEAKGNEKLLLLSFYDDDARYVPEPKVTAALQEFVLAELPASATLAADQPGEEDKPLLAYRAFRHLNNAPGLVIVNLKYHADKYGYVVATLALEDAQRSDDRVLQFLEDPIRKYDSHTLADDFGLDWHTDYAAAYAEAEAKEKLLFVAFDCEGQRFLPDGKTAGMLRRCVLARLRVEDSSELLAKEAFRSFHQAPGIGVIDLAHEGAGHGTLVHVVPGEYVTAKGVQAMLALAERASKLPPLRWQTDFEQAKKLAVQQKKMLLIAVDNDQSVFEPKPASVPVLHAYILLRQTTESEVRSEGLLRRLLNLDDLRPMREKAGLVIYDFQHEDEPYYGQVVSAMPFRYLGPDPGNRVFGEEQREFEFFTLEPNTLSRRTLTWAIRVSKGYGESQRLRSADGRPNDTLMAWALKNSELQKKYGCGHHAGGPMRAEIASPGPGEDIVDGALNMVRIWRSSPPHYGTMVRYHPEFGYDMYPSQTNHWYGTGRF
ncbi:MAG TPA: hypothetical protein VMY42_10965 [Thermoguttaceae bacterium]|nr:hypothetical protein [Thermoguttaceae bacterium]